MREWGRRGLAAWAAAALACPCASALAQTPGSAELDPTAPLEPLPDLGVEWPDMDAPDAPPPIEETDVASPESVESPPAGIDLDSSEVRRYSVGIVGMEGVDGGPELVAAFDAQSALRKGLGESSNAAQIDRRSRADAELLAELLRSRGYYDAAVMPRIEAKQTMIQVVLEAEPGRQYRFGSVELPGLEAAGEQAAGLRQAFSVQTGEPVIVQDVIDAMDIARGAGVQIIGFTPKEAGAPAAQ